METHMKPILFNTDMVQALLEGRKSVTRRIVKPQPWGTCPNTGGDHELEPDNFCGGVSTGFVCKRCGHGVCPPHMKYPVGEALFRPMCWPDDILYVRETWCSAYDGERYFYLSDKHTDREEKQLLDYNDVKWRPSIHMPREAARIFLRVRSVRVERLQDITPEQARAEGCDGRCNCPSSGSSGSMSYVIRDFSVEKFETVWDGTIKPADLDKYGWNANPWVWVIEFERISKEAALEVQKGGAG